MSLTRLLLSSFCFFIGCSTYKNVSLRLYDIENNKYGNIVMNSYFDNFMPGEMLFGVSTNFHFNVQIPLGVLLIENKSQKNVDIENITSSKWNLVCQNGKNIFKDKLCIFWNIFRYEQNISVPAKSLVAIVIGKNSMMPQYTVYQPGFPSDVNIWVEYNGEKSTLKSNPILGRYILKEIDESFSEAIYY